MIKLIAQSFKNKNLKKIVNVYQLKYKNGCAQGFGDFIRGCFCLLQICNILNLQFEIDIQNHPISKYILNTNLNPNKINYTDISRYANINYIPINSTVYIKNSIHFFTEFILNLNRLDPTCTTYYLFCNSLPIFDNIQLQGKELVRVNLLPNEIMRLHVQKRLSDLNLHSKQFNVIHVRNGDKYLLKNDQLNPKVISKIFSILSKRLNPEIKYLLLSDNNQIKYHLQQKFPQLICKNTNIVHLGESPILTDNAVFDTLLDFYIMSHCNHITGFSPHNWGTGFSKWCAILYNIEYTQFQVVDI